MRGLDVPRDDFRLSAGCLCGIAFGVSAESAWGRGSLLLEYTTHNSDMIGDLLVTSADGSTPEVCSNLLPLPGTVFRCSAAFPRGFLRRAHSFSNQAGRAVSSTRFRGTSALQCPTSALPSMIRALRSGLGVDDAAQAWGRPRDGRQTIPAVCPSQ
jgi:hypothetical protein